jgi:hypothetical protein
MTSKILVPLILCILYIGSIFIPSGVKRLYFWFDAVATQPDVYLKVPQGKIIYFYCDKHAFRSISCRDSTQFSLVAQDSQLIGLYTPSGTAKSTFIIDYRLGEPQSVTLETDPNVRMP